MIGVFFGGMICGCILGMVITVLCVARGNNRDRFDG